MLVRCSRHFRMVLQSQLNRCLDRFFAVTLLEEHWVQMQRLTFHGVPYQPEQRVLVTLFGEARVRGDCRVYCFVEIEGQSILSLTEKIYADIGFRVRDIGEIEDDNNYAPCSIFGKTKSDRDRFASCLRRRCEQQLATEAHSDRTDVMRRIASDV
jgi:hypothetical protein